MCILLFFADEAAYYCEMVYAGDGDVKGGVFGVVGGAKDVVFFFGGSHALDDHALVGVEHVGFAPLEKRAGVVDFSAGYDVAAQIAGVHAIAFDADKESAVAEGGDVVPFYVVAVEVGAAFEEACHRRQWNERNALARWGGYELRVLGASFFFGQRVVRGQHFALAGQKPNAAQIGIMR